MLMKRDKNMAKYVIRMLPEYMATCLWPVSDNAYDDLGIPIDYETLHLSKKLTEELKKWWWCTWYSGLEWSTQREFDV